MCIRDRWSIIAAIMSTMITDSSFWNRPWPSSEPSSASCSYAFALAGIGWGRFPIQPLSKALMVSGCQSCQPPARPRWPIGLLGPSSGTHSAIAIGDHHRPIASIIYRRDSMPPPPISFPPSAYHLWFLTWFFPLLAPGFIRLTLLPLLTINIERSARGLVFTYH